MMSRIAIITMAISTMISASSIKLRWIPGYASCELSFQAAQAQLARPVHHLYSRVFLRQRIGKRPRTVRQVSIHDDDPDRELQIADC